MNCKCNDNYASDRGICKMSYYANLDLTKLNPLSLPDCYWLKRVYELELKINQLKTAINNLNLIER